MINHVMVIDKKISLGFYEPLLATFNLSHIHDSEEYAGFGEEGHSIEAFCYANEEA